MQEQLRAYATNCLVAKNKYVCENTYSLVILTACSGNHSVMKDAETYLFLSSRPLQGSARFEPTPVRVGC